MHQKGHEGSAPGHTIDILVDEVEQFILQTSIILITAAFVLAIIVVVGHVLQKGLGFIKERIHWGGFDIMALYADQDWKRACALFPNCTCNEGCVLEVKIIKKGTLKVEMGQGQSMAIYSAC